MAIEPKPINITVDLTRPGIVNTQKEMRYGDKNLLTVEVTRGGEVIDLATIGAVTTDLVVKRLGSTEIDVVGQIIAGKAQFMLDGSSLAVAGYTKAAVYFYDENGDRISSADFAFTSLADPSLNAVGDTTEQTIIQQVLLNGPPIIEAAAQAQEEFETQQAAFVQFQTDSEMAFSNAQNQRTTDFNADQATRNTAFGVEQTARQTDYTNWKDQKTDELNQLASDTENVKMAAETATANANNATNAANTAATNANNKVAELNTYDTRLTNSENEITNARQSAAKSKTFTTLDDRLEELDNDTYFPITNKVTNGDFSNGTTGWTALFSSNSVSAGILSNTANGTINYGILRQSILTIGKSYYVKAQARVRSSAATTLRVNVGSHVTEISNPVQDTWYTLATVKTANATTLDFVHLYPDATTANGKVMEVRFVLATDLQETFETGNEPTKEEMDRLIAFYPNGFFSGTVNLAENKKMMKFLLNELRNKANKVREAFNNPTFQNGASGTVQYRLNDLGRLEFKGTLIVTGVATAFNLPVVYRPVSTTYAVVASATGTAILTIASTGNVSVSQAGTFFTSPISVAL